MSDDNHKSPEWPPGTPMKPGYYWAQWRIATDGTHEGDELTPSTQWEIVQVNANVMGWEDDPGEDEALSVSVPGVRETQWRENFVWGEFVTAIDKPAKSAPSPHDENGPAA